MIEVGQLVDVDVNRTLPYDSQDAETYAAQDSVSIRTEYQMINKSGRCGGTCMSQGPAFICNWPLRIMFKMDRVSVPEKHHILQFYPKRCSSVSEDTQVPGVPRRVKELSRG